MSVKVLLSLSLLALLVVACSTAEHGFLVPAQHPPEAELDLARRPVCTDCHDRRDKLAYEEFDHTPFFSAGHRGVAARQGAVCSMCHQASFCSDCHATSVELKPTERRPTETFRGAPHRGDYLTRHKIEGRIDPTSCFRCHGNPKTTRTCAPCHS